MKKTLTYIVGTYDLQEVWQGSNIETTYWIGRKENETFSIFGADWGGVLTVEDLGEFPSYASAKKYMTNILRFKAHMKRVL